MTKKKKSKTKKTNWTDGIGKWGVDLRLTLTTTEPVNLTNLGKIPGVKVSPCENGDWKYNIPVDDLVPERPCATTLFVTTTTNGKNPGVVLTDIEVSPQAFYYRNDPGQFLCRILKLEPGSLRISAVHISAPGHFGTLAEPKLDDWLLALPNGFLLEKAA